MSAAPVPDQGECGATGVEDARPRHHHHRRHTHERRRREDTEAEPEEEEEDEDEAGWAWRQRKGADASSNAASAMSPVMLAEGLSELSIVDCFADNSPLKHSTRRGSAGGLAHAEAVDADEDEEEEGEEDESLMTCTQPKNDDNTCAEPAITTVASGSEDEPSLDSADDSLAWTDDAEADDDGTSALLLCCGAKRVPVTVRCAARKNGADDFGEEDEEGRMCRGGNVQAMRGMTPSELTSTVAGSAAEKDLTEEVSEGFGSCDEQELAQPQPVPPRFVVTPVAGAAPSQLPAFGAPIVPAQQTPSAAKKKGRKKGQRQRTSTTPTVTAPRRRLFVDEECQESASARESKPFSRMNKAAPCVEVAGDGGGVSTAAETRDTRSGSESGASTETAPLTPSSSAVDEGTTSTMSRDDAVEALLRARLENSFHSARGADSGEGEECARPQRQFSGDDRRERAEPKHRTGFGSIFKRFSTKRDKPVPAPVGACATPPASGDAAVGTASVAQTSGEQQQQQQQQQEGEKEDVEEEEDEEETTTAVDATPGEERVEEDGTAVENDHPNMGKRNKSVPSFTVPTPEAARRAGEGAGAGATQKTHGGAAVNRSLDMTRKDKADARRRYEDNLFETEVLYAARLEAIVALFLAPLQQKCAEPADRPSSSTPGTPTTSHTDPEAEGTAAAAVSAAATTTEVPSLSEGEIRAVFGNIGALATCHRTVVAQMQQCAAAQRSVLHALAAQGSELAKLYTGYVQGFAAATRAATEMLARRPPLAAFVAAAERDPRCEGLVLHALLFSPLQRVMRYVTLLNACDAFTPKDDPLKRPIKRVLKKMRELSEGIFRDLEEQQRL